MGGGGEVGGGGEGELQYTTAAIGSKSLFNWSTEQNDWSLSWLTVLLIRFVSRK